MVNGFFLITAVMAHDVHVCGDPSSLYDPFYGFWNRTLLDGKRPPQEAGAIVAHQGSALVAHSRAATAPWEDAVSVANSHPSAAPPEQPSAPAGSITDSPAALPTSGPPFEIIPTGTSKGGHICRYQANAATGLHLSGLEE